MSWERTKSVRCDNKDEHGGHYYDEFGKTWFCPGVPKDLVGVLRQWDRIEAGSFIPQKDVPVTKGFGGPVLGKCEFMKYIRAQTTKIIREDHSVVEKVCEMSLLDPQQRGVLVNRVTGEVSLSDKVPYGSLYEYYPENHKPVVKLWMKEE